MVPVPSEAGHADFAARTDDELGLFALLRSRFGRVEVEHVLCGPGWCGSPSSPTTARGAT